MMNSHQSWALLVALVLFVALGFVHYMVRKSHARPSKGFNRFLTVYISAAVGLLTYDMLAHRVNVFALLLLILGLRYLYQLLFKGNLRGA